MNRELENKLYNIDPVFFCDAIACINGDLNEVQTCMAFGCECGDGWFEPLKTLANKTKLINSIAKNYNLKFVCCQLKEKFGGLRCYTSTRFIDENIGNTFYEDENSCEIVSSLNKMLDDAINAAENECWNVCERCGFDGGYNGENMITTSGWISRICKNCGKESYHNKTKDFDRINGLEYEPRITLFKEAYSFLSMYNIDGFSYGDNYYSSVIHAFYSIKDPEHANLYKLVVRFAEDKNHPALIELFADSLGVKCDENDYELMKNVLYAKFSYRYNEKIRNELIETKGYRLSNMGYHHDNLWGICHCDECKSKDQKDLYAKALTEVRDMIINEFSNKD